MRDYTKSDLKSMFTAQLKEHARDKNGTPITRPMVNGELMYITRGDVLIDKCISRAERGDMYAVKLIVDLLQPKELRIAVASAITIEHKLSEPLQAIVDKLLITNEKEKDNPDKNDKIDGGVKNGDGDPQN